MRDFGDTSGDCLKPVKTPDNFCQQEASKLADRDAPTSFIRYRNISGICNNLQLGKATVGAAGTITGRFFERKVNSFSFCQHSAVFAKSPFY